MLPHPQMQAVIKQTITTWDGVDLFEVHDFCKGGLLKAVVLVVLEHCGCIKDHNKPPKEYVNALDKIEGTYNPNAYHSAVHAVDVVLAQAVMLVSLVAGGLACSLCALHSMKAQLLWRCCVITVITHIQPVKKRYAPCTACDPRCLCVAYCISE